MFENSAFERRSLGWLRSPAFDPSSLPAIETLAVECDTDVLYFLSVEKLTLFASDRKNTTSARLCHVVIVDENGRFPSAALIRALGKHVPVADVRFGSELPKELT